MPNQNVLQVLLDWNPWVEGGFPEKLSGISRDYDILTYLEIPEIKILEGARRVGKSTLLYQVIQAVLEKSDRVLYINFDDPVLNQYTLEDLLDIYTEYAPVEYLFVDEIQNCRDWVPFVRKLYDQKRMHQIWITGSNSSLIKKEYATLLTGRQVSIQVMPLSFSEYLRFKNINIKKIPVSKAKAIELKKHFEDYLQFGAFPAIALRSTLQKELLINYFEDFLYKDIAVRFDVQHKKLNDLATYLASHSTQLYSYRKIAIAIGVHPKTVTDYIGYLRDIFLFSELHKFDFSLKKQLSHEKKIYCLDSGLASAVAFKFSEQRGRMLENIAYLALKRLPGELYFHKGKSECDFIVKQGYKVTQAIQVTDSLLEPATKKREIAGLMDALTTYNLETGLILTSDLFSDEIIEFNGKSYSISFRPLWQWLLTLPSAFAEDKV